MLKAFLLSAGFIILSSISLFSAQLNAVNTYVDLSTPSFNSVIPYDASGGRAAALVLPIVNGSTTTYVVPYSTNGYIGVAFAPSSQISVSSITIGTISLNSNTINEITRSTETYVYVSSIAWHTQSISLGAGTKCRNYSVLAIGGTVTYTLNGGVATTILTGYTDSEDILPFRLINPTIAITGLGIDTSAYIKITGSN